MKPIASLAAAVLLIAGGATAHAQTQATQPPKAHRMAGLDADKDGAIDRAEAAKAPRLLEHFDRLDANRDGRGGNRSDGH